MVLTIYADMVRQYSRRNCLLPNSSQQRLWGGDCSNAHSQFCATSSHLAILTNQTKKAAPFWNSYPYIIGAIPQFLSNGNALCKIELYSSACFLAFLLPSYILYCNNRLSNLPLKSFIFREGRNPTYFIPSKLEVMNHASVLG